MTKESSPYSLSSCDGSNPEFVDTCSHDQSKAMFEFLTARGLPVEMSERGYMIIRERNAGRIREAMQLIFDNRNELPGWWNLKNEMIRQGICSTQQFEEARTAFTRPAAKDVA
jgi:hypothetical protein